MAYQKVNWNLIDTFINPTNLGKMDTGIYDLDNDKADKTTTYDKDYIDTKIAQIITGWNPVIETVTYASVDNPSGTVYFSGNVTTKYTLGNKVKMTNSGNVIYGKITKMVYDSGNNRTEVTFLHEINYPNNTAKYLLQNSAITEVYFSNIISPSGFPTNPDKWTILITDMTDKTQKPLVASTWYPMLNGNIPIGLWKDISYEAFLVVIANTGMLTLTGYATLSTTPNSQSDASMTFPMYMTYSGTGVAPVISNLARKSKVLNLSVKTPYYLNVRTTVSNIAEIQTLGSFVTTAIKAVCAYL